MPNEEEEYVIEVKDEVVVDPVLKDYITKTKQIGYSPTEPGCGSLVGFKIAQKILEAPIVVLSGHLSGMAEYPQPFSTIAVDNAAATALALSRYNNGVLAFAGDGFTLNHLSALVGAAKKNTNFIYICYNNAGYSLLKRNLDLSYFSKMLDCTYVASASISHPEDYIKKLNKAKAMHGFRFIDLFSPCPSLGFAPTDSVHVARLAVETGIWPLYERVEGKKEVTLRLPRLEPVERYFELQKTRPDEAKLKILQEKVTKNWKLLLS
jgi:pyruvate/2-oxoacid:ferredoxin oxidoreductase beta subunit